MIVMWHYFETAERRKSLGIKTIEMAKPVNIKLGLKVFGDARENMG